MSGDTGDGVVGRLPRVSISYGRVGPVSNLAFSGWYFVREGLIIRPGTIPIGLGPTWALASTGAVANLVAAAPAMRALLRETLPGGVAVTHWDKWRRRVVAVVEAIDGHGENEIIQAVLEEELG